MPDLNAAQRAAAEGYGEATGQADYDGLTLQEGGQMILTAVANNKQVRDELEAILRAIPPSLYMVPNVLNVVLTYLRGDAT